MLALPYFSTLSHKRRVLRGWRGGEGVIEHKIMFFFLSLQIFSEKFLILRRIQGDIVINVCWSACKVRKWVQGIFPGVKAAGAHGWRPTTLVVPNVKKIRGFSRPGTPWACPGLLRDDLYLYLHVKYPLFLSGFNETWHFLTGFRKILKYQIVIPKSSRWDPSCYMRTDGQTDTTKLTIGFRSFAKAPSK